MISKIWVISFYLSDIMMHKSTKEIFIKNLHTKMINKSKQQKHHHSLSLEEGQKRRATLKWSVRQK